MIMVNKGLCKGLISGLLLVAANSAYAIPVTYDFSVTGTVLAEGTKTVTVTKSNGSPTSPPTEPATTPETNAYGLSAGDTITAYGSFTADLGPSMSGTVLFDLAAFTTYGNVLTIDMNGALAGGTLLHASNDTSYMSGGGAYLTFSNGALTDFDYLKTTSPKFNSSFMYFDDLTSSSTSVTSAGKTTTTTYESMLGEWGPVVVTPIPEASTYAMMLAGLGLVGFMGARRKSLHAAA